MTKASRQGFQIRHHHPQMKAYIKILVNSLQIFDDCEVRCPAESGIMGYRLSETEITSEEKSSNANTFERY